MSSLFDDARVAAALPRLAPYALRLVERSAVHARRIQAEAIGIEHLLGMLLDEEDCAAHRALVHSFADPETISIEVLAISPGILVVGSGRSLPFSVRGARALERAREIAAEGRAASVDPGHLALAAVGELEDEARSALEGAGYVEAGLAGSLAAPAASDAVPASGLLFSHFASATKHACGVACRTAVQLQRETISPAHLVFAALESDPELQQAAGLTLMRARAVLTGRDDDATPVPPRAMPVEDAFAELLGALEPGADSLELLAGVIARGSTELLLLLEQHRVNQELVDGARGAFRDPKTPPDGP